MNIDREILLQALKRTEGMYASVIKKEFCPDALYPMPYGICPTFEEFILELTADGDSENIAKCIGTLTSLLYAYQTPPGQALLNLGIDQLRYAIMAEALLRSVNQEVIASDPDYLELATLTKPILDIINQVRSISVAARNPENWE